MPLNTTLQCATGEYSLFRYPKNQHDAALQAWDSADELVIDYVANTYPAEKYITILNDQFGAIAIALNQFNRVSVTDSRVSELATIQNGVENKIVDPIFCNSLEPIPSRDVVIIKLTKSVAYLQDQLQLLARNNTAVDIIACGKTTQVTSKVMSIFEKYCDNVKTSLAKKKSRLIFATLKNTAKSAPEESSVEDRLNYIDWPEQGIRIGAYANVFSHDGLDIGGRFLAENLPVFTADQKVVDLGCGNGLLGLAVLKQTTQSETPISLRFVDESHMAIASAKHNIEQTFPENLSQCDFILDDCLTKQKAECVDVILCNPPFHQQNTLTEHIAKQMFRQSLLALKPGGSLYVVANSHLPYQSYLKKMFGGFKVHAQNKKFSIYHCIKRA